MNVRHLAMAILVMAMASAVGVQAWNMKYYDVLGPGPGFFPLWAAISLGLLGAAQAVMAIKEQASPVVDGVKLSGLVRVVGVVCLLSLAVLGLERAGYEITMLVFAASMLLLLRSRLRIAGVALVLVMSVGTGYVFRKLLGVPLPLGILGG